MNSFQKTVVTIAVIILIICLILIGIALHNHNAKAEYPPVISNCPDYWITDGDGCIPPSDGSYNPPPGCDSMPGNLKGKCRKQKWAKKCNLSWDGITNNEQICKSHHH